MRILVISAHPDDEVLGMGGTIKKLAKKGNIIHLCVVSEGASAQYMDKKMIEVRRKACMQSSKLLGIKKIDFLNFSDMKLDSIPQIEINKKIEEIISKFKPEIVFTTPNNDVNKDHQVVHECTLVACRQYVSKVKKIIAYEIPGSRVEQFHPNTYYDIGKEMDTKIKAFKYYKSEIESYPHPRSIEFLKILSKFRGVEAGVELAEGFELIRETN